MLYKYYVNNISINKLWFKKVLVLLQTAPEE